MAYQAPWLKNKNQNQPSKEEKTPWYTRYYPQRSSYSPYGGMSSVSKVDEEESNDDASEVYQPRYTTYTSPVRTYTPPPLTKKEKKKASYYYTPTTYSYSNSRWGAFTGYSTTNTSDDNHEAKMIVKEPTGYVTPTSSIIKTKSSGYLSDSDVIKIKEMARVCYLKMLDDKNFLKEHYKQSGNLNSDLNERISFYLTFYDTYLPGNTPLEQSLCLFDKYYANKKSHTTAKDGGGFSKNIIAKFKRDVYESSLSKWQFEKYHKLESNKLAILNNISMLGDFGHHFVVEKESEEREVLNSTKVRVRRMRSFSELHKATYVERMMPTFHQRLATKSLRVKVNVQDSDKKQKIIILCDKSGSMNDGFKQLWVNSILTERFNSVLKGDAEIYFSYFVSYVDELQFYHIKDEKDVEYFWHNVINNHPNGGATDINRIVKYVAQKVSNGESLRGLKNCDLSREKPEILIINDGQLA